MATNKQQWAIISHLETVFTFHKSDALPISLKPGSGRVSIVPIEKYEERYAEYNKAWGLNRG